MHKNWLILPLSFIIIGCGSTSDTNTEKGSIDISTFLESKNVSKNYQKVSKSKDATQSDEFFTEESTVTNNKVERKINNVTDSIITIEESQVVKNDISKERNVTTAFKRHVDEASTLFLYDINMTQVLKEDTQEVGTQTTKGTRTCQLLRKLDGFTHKEHTYTGEILEVRCTKAVTITTTVKPEFVGKVQYVSGNVDAVDIFSMYSKKGTGLVAYIDDDCITDKGVVNDEAEKCNDENYKFEQYEYVYFLGN